MTFTEIIIKRMAGLIETANKDSAWEMEAVAEMMKATHLLHTFGPAQSEKPCGEPVAWRWKTVPGGNQWFVRDYEPDLELIAVHSVEPLYASPPSSSWGLRERVATIVKEYMSGIESEHLRNIFQEMLHDIDEELSSVSSTEGK